MRFSGFFVLFLLSLTVQINLPLKLYTRAHTVSHKSEYTSHISVIILVYLFKGQYYRNETWIYFRVVNVQCIAVKIYCTLKITQNTVIIVKKSGNKREYTRSDNSYTSFNHAKPHVLFIMFMFLSA